MEDNKQHMEDLREIKSLMERSSRFLSLSGLSGVSAGIIALIGAAVGYYLLDYGNLKYDEYFDVLQGSFRGNIQTTILLVGLCTLILAVLSAYYFSYRKAKKRGLAFWSQVTKRMLYHFLIPLAAGGLLALIMLFRNDITLLASITLIFYGLALVSASKYTLREVHYLGISEIVLGLLAGIFIHQGLIFWAVGFGLMHILYGAVMYYKYER